MKVGDLVRHKNPARGLGILIKIANDASRPWASIAKICWVNQRIVAGQAVPDNILYRLENLEIVNESR